MNEEMLKKNVSAYLQDIFKETDIDKTEKILLTLCCNIESQTRDRCMALAYDLAHDIHNLNKEEETAC